MTPDRIPQSPPKIYPVDAGTVRPLWSVMIPTYNCIGFLEDTLQSVLQDAQTPDSMQIEVVDDCSTDGDVEAMVRRVGKGRIGFFRQEKNVGSLRNFETCIQRSKGKLLHILHGDDMVKPGFYATIENLFNQYPGIGAAFTGFSAIDEKGQELYHNDTIQEETGIVKDWLMKIGSAQVLRTSAVVVKRTVYEELGGFFAVHYGEDWEMLVRIAAKYPVASSPKNLALYRLHTNNISTRSFATGENIKDIKKVIGIIQQYFPAEKRQEMKAAAMKHFSRHFAGNAQDIYRNGAAGNIALKQARGALSMNLNRKTVISLLRLYIKVFLRIRRLK